MSYFICLFLTNGYKLHVVFKISYYYKRNEMSRNVKQRTFRHVRPEKILISLRIRAVWSESSLCAFWIAENAIWSDCTDAQDDLNHTSVHISKSTFSDVAGRLTRVFFFFTTSLQHYCLHVPMENIIENFEYYVRIQITKFTFYNYFFMVAARITRTPYLA